MGVIGPEDDTPSWPASTKQLARLDTPHPAQISHRQVRKERKESQALRIQPRTRDGNHPGCSGVVIRGPLESAGLSLRTNGEAVGTGVLCG